MDITVATDDIAEQQVVSGKGGNRISTRQLYIEVNNAQVKIQEKIQKTVKNKRNTLDDFLDKEMIEKLNDMRKKIYKSKRRINVCRYSKDNHKSRRWR